MTGRTRWTAVVAGLTLAGVILAGCGIGSGCGGIGGQAACTHGPTGMPGGLSRDTAIADAGRMAPIASQGQGPEVVWAEIENDPFISPFASPATAARLVWMVRLQGRLAVPSCSPGFESVGPSPTDPACLDGDGGVVAVLDYFTGSFIGWTH